MQTDKLEALKAEYANEDVDILSVTCNVADANAVKAMVDATVERFGRLDYAVNCAGITGTPSPMADTNVDDWAKTISVNQNGVYYCLREQLGAMSKQEGIEG